MHLFPEACRVLLSFPMCKGKILLILELCREQGWAGCEGTPVVSGMRSWL